MSTTITLDTPPPTLVAHDTVSAAADRPHPLLSVRDLNIGFEHVAGPLVRGVSFDLHPGRCVALVGESGSGKSLTARTLVGLTGDGAQVTAGRLTLTGTTGPGSTDLDLLGLTPREWRRVRGGRIGFVLQDALVSLDPLRRVGAEIDEALRLHTGLSRRDRKNRVHRLLADVGVPAPELRARERPAQLSGGLRQRALIASAIAAEPDVLIADEPTTALDATVQAQVLELLAQRRAAGQSLILISHDLAVVAELADEVLVMKAGEVVEQGPPGTILADPHHPYTRALVQAIPGPHTRGTRLSENGAAPTVDSTAGPALDTVPAPALDTAPTSGTALAPTSGTAPAPASGSTAATASGTATHPSPGTDVDTAAETTELVLDVRGVSKTFRTPGGERRVAVADVRFTLARGEVLGIVGESGSGKSTTGRIVLGLEDVDAGDVRLLGEDWSHADESRRRVLRHRLSVVWQDPLSSFDPRWTVRRILSDAIRVAERDGSVPPPTLAELLTAVGLPHTVADRDPATLSGGQRQRVAIARSLAGSPDVLVLDEAVSALDVSIQAQILDLLHDLRAQRGLSCLFISHDLGVIAHMSDRVLVMKDGAIVEEGHPRTLFEAPAHPYTRTLVDSALGLSRPRTPSGDARITIADPHTVTPENAHTLTEVLQP